MMRSTALTTIFILHIMYISLARGFIPSSSLHHRHHGPLSFYALQATRQDDDMLATSSRVVQTPTTPRRRPMPSVNNNSNQYTQFFKENVLVGIQRTSPNSRRISGEMIMNIPIDTIWNILTDYDNLSVHVPNLVESRVISGGGGGRGGGGAGASPRVYQKGAQRIFGFEFGADVTMDMTEHVHHHHRRLASSSSSSSVDNEEGMSSSKQCRVIDFKCVDSQFFSEFDGSWIVEEYYNDDTTTSSTDDAPITMVRYVVDVRPKGPVPVAALEWRIKEDVPVNILAVSKAATAIMTRQQQAEQSSPDDVVTQVSLSNQQQQQIPSSAVPAPSSSASSSPRRQSSRQRLQPLERLTNQATANFKRISKSVLPSPVYSTAKQAMNIINDNLPRPMRRVVVPTMTSSSLQTDSSNTGSTSSKDSMDVDWYEDETMAMYL